MTAGLIERCYRCPRTWGVTTPPRERVLCMPCFRSRCHRDPFARAQAAIRNLPVPYVHAEPGQRPTPQDIADARVAIADRYTSLADLRIALECARDLPLAPDDQPTEETPQP